MDRSKDAVAERLAQAHYAVDPDIELIIRLESPGAGEADPHEPVKLLEVNPATIPAGIIPLYFGAHPSSGIFYPATIVEVTPDEYAAIRAQPATLPQGWNLGREFRRLSTAKVG